MAGHATLAIVNVFELRENVGDYDRYVSSFMLFCDERIIEKVQSAIGGLCPAPLVQVNPAFAAGDRFAKR